MKVGPYQLVEVVGTGGTGAVYRAVHPETGRLVAVKLLSTDAVADPQILSRVERDCADASRLEHPHLARSLGFGVDGSRPYVASEFVDGQSLARQVKRHGPLPEEEAVRLTVQVADALDLAHRHDLVHRGVNPESILLAEGGHPKLTGLGLPRGMDAPVASQHSTVGLGSVA